MVFRPARVRAARVFVFVIEDIGKPVMPTYVYKPAEGEKGCDYCAGSFETVQKMSDEALKKCPECGCGVRRVIMGIRKGPSQSGFDRKAQEQGFHKLKRRDKGTYEKLY